MDLKGSMNEEPDEEIADVDFETSADLARFINKRIRKNYDGVIAFTGEEGEGKSEAAIDLSMKGDEKFEIERNELFQPKVEEVQTALTQLPKYSYIIADEAIRILYKLKRFDKIQIFLNMLYALARQENQVTILCMPRYTDFNEFFRRNRIKIWVYMIRRGVGLLHVKSKNPYTADPWDLDGCAKRLGKNLHGRLLEELDDEELDKVLRKSVPTYKNIVRFDQIPEDIRSKYLELKKKFAYQDLAAEQGVEEDPRVELNKKRLATAFTVLHEVCGFTKETLNEMLEFENGYEPAKLLATGAVQLAAKGDTYFTIMCKTKKFKENKRKLLGEN